MIDARTLVLFDVDGTLINTLGAGINAVERAGRALYGPHFDASLVSYAGRLDPVIFRDLLRAHGEAHEAPHVARFREQYGTHLPEAIDGEARACPGALDLVEALEGDQQVTLGLLTGNFPETGTIKLRACGIDPERFPIRVWSTCPTEPLRSAMPPVGVARWEAMHTDGVPEDPRRVVIVGDTPEDVAYAKANGCRCLAVATGHFDVETLLASGADHAVGTLEATDDLCAWITRR